MSGKNSEIKEIKAKLIDNGMLSFYSDEDMITLRFVKARGMYTLIASLKNGYNIQKDELDRILFMLNETQFAYTYLYDCENKCLIVKTSLWAKKPIASRDIQEVVDEMVSVCKSLNAILKETANG